MIRRPDDTQPAPLDALARRPQPAWPSRPQALLPPWPVLGLLAGATLGLSLLSLVGAWPAAPQALQTHPSGLLSTWGLANAVAIVALARSPRWHWPALLALVAVLKLLLAVGALGWPGLPGLAGVGAVAVSGAVAGGGAAGPLALAWLPAHGVEILLGAWLLQREGLESSSLRSPATLLRVLLLGAVLPQALAAEVAAVCAALLGLGPVGLVALAWFKGAALGALSVLPVALLLAGQPWPRLRLALADVRFWLLAPMSVTITVLCLTWLPFPFVSLALPLLVGAVCLDLVAVALLTLGVSVAPLQLFVHAASQDLREPINTIAQFSQLINQDYGAALPPDVGRYRGLVQREAERLHHGLDDVLRYAQLQGADLAAASARLRVPPLAVRVRGHAPLLALLLHHLLDNALKFVAPGQAAEIALTLRCDAGSAWLTVADRGIGISPEQQARLFEPFQRLHLPRDCAGTGLGLALCRQIAQAHGGELTVQSALRDGARFTLRLPLWRGPDGAMPSGLDAAGEPRVG